MNKRRILIVEDESKIAEVLVAYCNNEGFLPTHFATGSGVVEYVKSHPVDMILLDLMLPEVDGITLCRQIRQFSDVPIMMLTAKTEEIDRLLGLELGADDYICKPFSPREVIARIKVIFRRIPESSENKLVEGGFAIYPDQFIARYDDKPLDLTPGEFRLLSVLVQHPGRVFSRESLIEYVYLDDLADVTDRNIDTHIKNIRKKIKQHANDFCAIESVYGEGYRLKKQL